MYCVNCATELSDLAETCTKCGHPTGAGKSAKSRTTAAVLCFFLGVLGIHRFYVGKVGTGILQLLTLGGLGFWSLIDFIMILCGSFKDAQGKKLG